MNGKPGELAIVVDSADGDQTFLGRVLTTVSLVEDVDGGRPAWLTDPLLEDPRDGMLIFWFDTSLKPIRDPGDDAVDESAAWLPPVPLSTIDPALLPERADA